MIMIKKGSKGEWLEKDTKIKKKETTTTTTTTIITLYQTTFVIGQRLAL
jgi:hypothetical protein